MPLQTTVSLFGTTESGNVFSGHLPPDTRDVQQFRLIPSNLFRTLDAENSFSAKEMLEITKSLVDIRVGNVRTFSRTEDLFAFLDEEL